MNSNQGDLLNFNDFPSVHGSSVTNTATLNNDTAPQISVNSPKRTQHSVDPLEELISDMSSSIPNFGESGDMDFHQQQQQQQQQSPQQPQQPNDEEATKPAYNFWSIEYYQQFFNVDTMMVIDRIASSIIPKRAPPNYLKSHISLNPDLYGPFWIIVTLVFSIAISGNIASYLQIAEGNYHWKYNFHLVSQAATAIFFYSVFVPGALWAVLKASIKPVDEDLETEMSTYTPSLLSLMCIYGYSLAIYIPVSILWVIQVSFLQWLLVITAALLSGSALIFVLAPALRNSKYSFILIIGIVALHFILAAGFMLYFFHAPGNMEIEVEKTISIINGSKSVVVKGTETG